MDRVEVGRFAGPAIPGSELQGALNAAMADLLAEPESLAELARHGLDEEVLRGVEFSVEEAPGTDPGSVVAIISMAAAGQLSANAIQALCAMVLRRARKRKGHDAPGKEL
jgi:hypothetical protein